MGLPLQTPDQVRGDGVIPENRINLSAVYIDVSVADVSRFLSEKFHGCLFLGSGKGPEQAVQVF